MARVVLAPGFHFGHDASAMLVDRDGLVRFLDKERRSRVKQAIGLGATDFEEVLPETGDVVVGLSVTQELPIFVDPAIGLSYREREASADRINTGFRDWDAAPPDP